MCGRFVATTTPALLADYLGVDEVSLAVDHGALDPSWNVAPTDPVYAVAEARSQGTGGEEGSSRRLLGTYKWGLVPYWAKDPGVGSRMINARAETLESKFKRTFERRRCLIPADGFYEWEKRDDGTKQPWFIHRADGAPMVFAALWELWRPKDEPDADPLRTCSIITTEANDLVAKIHGRMPAVIAPSDWERWLDRDAVDTALIRGLLAPADARQFEMFEVSTRVNSVRNNGAELIEALPTSRLTD